MSEEQRYYEKTVYVCVNCGKRWDTPGSAELCHKKDHVMDLVNRMDAHKTIALDYVISQLEEHISSQDGGSTVN